MKILIGCERSGIVREAFRKLGHDAVSCDIEPADDCSPAHIQGDVLDVIHEDKWDMMICHPPCTYLSVSGLHWNKRRPERARLTHEAIIFFLRCAESPIPRIAIENPIGCMSRIWRKPDQIIQPYQFGDDASKATCLWLKGLSKLAIDPAKRFPGRLVTMPNGKVVERWSNQTDSGQNRLGPSPDRAQKRSQTYPGIALAFAETWSLLNK